MLCVHQQTLKDQRAGWRTTRPQPRHRTCVTTKIQFVTLIQLQPRRKMSKILIMKDQQKKKTFLS